MYVYATGSGPWPVEAEGCCKKTSMLVPMSRQRLREIMPREPGHSANACSSTKCRWRPVHMPAHETGRCLRVLSTGCVLQELVVSSSLPAAGFWPPPSGFRGSSSLGCAAQRNPTVLLLGNGSQCCWTSVARLQGCDVLCFRVFMSGKR